MARSSCNVKMIAIIGALGVSIILHFANRWHESDEWKGEP